MEASKSVFGGLARERFWGDSNGELYQWQGFWYLQPHLEAAIAAKSRFQAHDEDILLASSMKTGTTWLKALIPCIMSYKGPSEDNDPLIKHHPNALIPSIVQIFQENLNPDLSIIPSPRLFRTHLPFSMLSDSIKNSACKIVYITRDPKDTFVSLWHFMNAKARLEEEEAYPLNEAFESFCKGIHPFGPFHDHVVQYWKESLKKPERILFLKYEELKRDPKGQVQKLASFLGRPLVEEADVDDVLWRCSFERLKDLEVNKVGVDPRVGFAHSSYYRRGLVGDWKNHLTMEMKERLDKITRTKLEGSGLDL